jgi:hypothetical protein
MSGSSLMMRPLTPTLSEFAYDSVIQVLGLKKLGPTERIEALLKVPSAELLTKVPPSIPLMPVVDGDLIPDTVSFSQISSIDEDANFSIPGKEWCEDLIVGDTQFDVSNILTTTRCRVNVAERFLRIRRQFLHT